MCMARKRQQAQVQPDPAAAAPLLPPPPPEALPAAIGVPDAGGPRGRRALLGGWRAGLQVSRPTAY